MNKYSVEFVYQKYIDDIYRFCYYKLSSKEEAEDISAEVFVKYAKQNNPEKIKNVRAWLYTVARNLVINQYRKKSRSEISLNSTVNNTIDGDDFNYEDFLPDDKDIEAEFVRKELVDFIRYELEAFDEQTREIITLRIWDEISFVEISEITNISVDAVKKRFYRGIRLLKSKIKMAEDNNNQNYNENTNLDSNESSIIAAIKTVGINPDYKPDTAFKESLFEELTKDIPKLDSEGGGILGLLQLSGANLLFNLFAFVGLGIAAVLVLSLLTNSDQSDISVDRDTDTPDEQIQVSILDDDVIPVEVSIDFPDSGWDVTQIVELAVDIPVQEPENNYPNSFPISAPQNLLEDNIQFSWNFIIFEQPVTQLRLEQFENDELISQIRIERRSTNSLDETIEAFAISRAQAYAEINNLNEDDVYLTRVRKWNNNTIKLVATRSDQSIDIVEYYFQNENGFYVVRDNSSIDKLEGDALENYRIVLDNMSFTRMPL